MDWRSAIPSFLKEQALDLYISDRPDGEVLLDCALGTNPLGMPPAVRQVLQDGSYHLDLAAYPVDPGPFVTAVSEFWNGCIHPEEILPGAGTMEILFNLLRLFGHRHTIVLGLSPQFPDVPQRFRLSGARYRTVRLMGPAYRLDAQALIRAISHEVALVYLDQPHNPTGQAWAHEDLARIARRCGETGALLVVDEAYGASLPEEQSAVMLPDDSVVVLRSFSKIWGLAGLRAGYAVCRCPDFREYYRKSALPVSLCRPAIDLVPIALRDRKFLEVSRTVFRETKGRLLQQILGTPGISLAATDATPPILFIEPKGTGEDLYHRLLGGGILTERGNCYEGVAPGGVRIRIPAPDQMALFETLWRQIFS